MTGTKSPRVAIITRTKDRPLMLKRALSSVGAQTFGDYHWVVVNDGGAPGPVDAEADVARTMGLSVRVIHHEQARGRWAAANAGLEGSESEYVVLHDDDDSWETLFLEKTVGYLSGDRHDKVRGVLTRCLCVVEEVREGGVIRKRVYPYDAELEAMTLFRMARLHLVPPPISFLFERRVIEEIGGFRNDLPVLGDWEFYLRYLRCFDLGVIPQYLARYHWRETLGEGAYRNSVVGDVDVHVETASRLRNELLRNDLDAGQVGVGMVVNVAHELERVNGQLRFYSKLASPARTAYRRLRHLGQTLRHAMRREDD